MMQNHIRFTTKATSLCRLAVRKVIYMVWAETGVAAQAPVNLTNCDREPIHQIGFIQPIGFLIALSPDWLVTRLSANAPAYLGRSVQLLLGIPFHEVANDQAIHTIRNKLSLLYGADAVERAFALQLQDGGPLFDLAIHMTGRAIVIEAEPSQPQSEMNAAAMARLMLARMEGQANMLRTAARLVQGVTGFDRVMIYRFHPDGSGEVVAERVRAGLEPFLGLRYPAEDIPRQARALLVRNPVRLLADVDAVPSPILSWPAELKEPLDLSLSVLRAHSTMCIEYLRNMGVGATMTVSLLRDGKLWGLISCHHMQPRHVGFDQRATTELFAQMLSFLIDKGERDELVAYEARARQIHNELIASVVQKNSATGSIAELASRMTELVPCDGIAVCVDGNVTLNDATPTPAEFVALRNFLDHTGVGQVYATDALGDAYPPARGFAEPLAGMLVIPVSRSPRDYLVFFRHEIARAVTWAGQPGKLLTTGLNGARLTPRKSFEAWRETVAGHSAPWTEPELRAAESLRVTLLEVVLQLTGVTEKESRAAMQKQELLVAELNHRVRNILALIRGLVAQSRTSGVDVGTFAAVLGDRVHALARAHDQITAKNWDPGSLTTLIAKEASAYLGAGAARVHASGPAVLLHPQAFSAVALVIHELMTNAAKYGALANQDGQVTIEWALDDVHDLSLSWSESDGPQVHSPTRRGFGTTIIERSVPHELGGEATLDYRPTGVRAYFTLPARHVVIGDAATADQAETATVAATALAARLSGLALLVEDNTIIALDAENVLLALGANRVGVASNIQEALRLIEAETPSFALLDVNLGIELSWPVATRLRELGVPHVFATGYGDAVIRPAEHRSTPLITKPYTPDAIARAVGQVAIELYELPVPVAL